jgi:hypothetical protein
MAMTSLQLVRSPVVHAGAIRQCAYCSQTAVLQIPATPGDVCQKHAIEFWTDLLAFARERSTSGPEPEAPCRCWICNHLSATARAIAAGAADGGLEVGC